jgi:heat shock protein HslJ
MRLSHFVFTLMMLPPAFAGAADLSSLAGSEWGFGDGDPRMVQFRSAGELAGHGGCNRFFGTYRQDAGGKLTIGPVGATRMACAEEVMEREQAFFALLEGTARAEASHLVLRLLDVQGKELAVLKRRDFD